jgi:DNA modification methylase
VLDPFIGSGTTAIACKELNRQFIGFEIDPKWNKVSIDRLNNIDAHGQISLIAR